MKVAVTSQGKDLDSPVDPRFGRASYFIVVDTDTMEFDAIENTQNVRAAQGAGVQSAQTVADSGAKVVLTGNCGPKAFSTLSAAGIKVIIGVEGTVREAVESFKEGRYESSTGPNVSGHW